MSKPIRRLIEVGYQTAETLARDSSAQQSDDFLDAPDVFRDASFVTRTFVAFTLCASPVPEKTIVKAATATSDDATPRAIRSLTLNPASRHCRFDELGARAKHRVSRHRLLRVSTEGGFRDGNHDVNSVGLAGGRIEP